MIIIPDLPDVQVEEVEVAFEITLTLCTTFPYCFFGLAMLYYLGVVFTVEENETLDPVHVSLLSAVRVVFGAKGLTNLIEQFGGFVFHFSPCERGCML